MNIIDLEPSIRMLLLESPGQTYPVRRGDSVIVIDTGTVGQAGSVADGLADWGLGKEPREVVLGHGSPLTGTATAALRVAAHSHPIPDPLG